ncbi:MAG: SDR family NAD(P)-dependent oxidoreductase [Thermaurantimonas sp.]
MKTIIVTGGSGGIGLETIKRLIKSGHRVVNLSRRQPPVGADTDNFIHLPTDLKNIDSGNLRLKLNELGKIDIIFNNAGMLINKPFLSITHQELVDVYQTNVFSVFTLVQIAFDFLAPDAHVVNVSSIGGINGTQKFPGLSAYSSSKGALTILTECLQAEFSNTGMSFNGLAFGAVQTEMLENAFPGYRAPITADKISEFVVWFLLHGNTFFKGKILPVSISNP